jgi:hypothetical protein
VNQLISNVFLYDVTCILYQKLCSKNSILFDLSNETQKDSSWYN